MSTNQFSYSKINTYKSCPQKYKIIYIDKINTSNESIEAFVGKAVHSVLEWLYKKDSQDLMYVSFDQLEDRYNKEWNDKVHNHIYLAYIKIRYKKSEDRKKYNFDFFKKQGIETLRKYYNRYGPDFSTTDVLDVEKEFSIQIENFIIRGYIDRIDKIKIDKDKEDAIVINDYKTGKHHSKKELIKDMQLRIYMLAVKEIYDSSRIIFNWHYLKNKYNKIEITEDEILGNKSFEQLKSSIIKYIKKINSENSYNPNPSILCEWCYYWDYCEEKKDQIHQAINL